MNGTRGRSRGRSRGRNCVYRRHLPALGVPRGSCGTNGVVVPSCEGASTPTAPRAHRTPRPAPRHHRAPSAGPRPATVGAMRARDDSTTQHLETGTSRRRGAGVRVVVGMVAPRPKSLHRGARLLRMLCRTHRPVSAESHRQPRVGRAACRVGASGKSSGAGEPIEERWFALERAMFGRIRAMLGRRMANARPNGNSCSAKG